ncbi:DnaJ domain-containing protein [Flavobacterium myungsuense]|uniref:DnaJ domain-containing protein n=1 Tax=Flavobacterium myungsuense TaxID=651823 RepID=UPI0036335F39
MDYTDYYKILEINKKATADDIKKAYRTLAKKYHPDKNLGDKKAEERFKLVNEANEVLGDPEKESNMMSWEKIGNKTNKLLTNKGIRVDTITKVIPIKDLQEIKKIFPIFSLSFLKAEAKKQDNNNQGEVAIMKPKWKFR